MNLQTAVVEKETSTHANADLAPKIPRHTNILIYWELKVTQRNRLKDQTLAAREEGKSRSEAKAKA